MTHTESSTDAGTTWFVGGFGPDMGGQSDGISVMRSRADGSLVLSHLAAPVLSPSFVLVDGQQVYATLEGAGEVAMFNRDGEALSDAVTCSSGGEHPCHLSVQDSVLIAANYATGSLGVMERSAHADALSLRHSEAPEGSGPRPQQHGPHAHASIFIDDTTVATLDLGADRIRIYDYSNGALHAASEVVLPAGFGPRDIVARAGDLYYVLGELGCSFLVFEWKEGAFQQLCSIALPGASEGDFASAIALSDDGRHAYVGIRQSNLIAVLVVADDGRSVAPLTAVSCEGDWPRHIVLHDGVLHVSNQLSHSIASFRIDQNGIPQLIAPPTRVLSPTYLARIV